jgi:2'-hydroxyisoflavone reductase
MKRPPSDRHRPSRRDVLRYAAAGAALTACGGGGKSASPPPPDRRPRPAARKREDGKLDILILGGTGFLGPAIVDAARPRGHTLTLFNRGKTNPNLFPEVEKLQGDRDGKLDALKGRSWDAVVDTSGYVPRIVKMSTELLAPATQHYVFVSTISVYAGFEKPNADEDAPLATLPDPTSEDVPQHYGALKALCEKAAEAAMPGRVANIRPGLIVGPRDPTGRFTYWPVRVARGGEILAPGSGADPVQLIDVRDLAEWIVEVIEKKVVGTYNALGPAERLEMAAMLKGVGEGVGVPDPKLVWVPAEFLEQQKVAPWQDMPVWIPAAGDMAGAGTMSNARAAGKGLRFRPISDTAKATLEWVNGLDAETRVQVTAHAGLKPDREVEVLTAWRDRDKKAKPGKKARKTG